MKPEQIQFVIEELVAQIPYPSKEMRKLVDEALAALESEEVLAEGRVVAVRWPVQGRKGYFLSLDLDLKGPDRIPLRYVILAVKEGNDEVAT